MASGSDSGRGMWSNRWVFVLAAAGSAVGLGNIWKFPYIAGENGGGAFVLIYLVCVGIVGIPIMICEVMLGRTARSSPIHAMRKLADKAGVSRHWTFIGWMGVVAGFLILSYYAVIAGWALNYVLLTAQGTFTAISAEGAALAYNDFLASPIQLMFWHALFMVLTIWIVGRGVSRGLESAIRWFMPILFVLLVVLLGYSFTSAGFEQGLAFMFDTRFEAVSGETWLVAMGQAFFTLSLGMGAMMAYGSYLPENISIGKTVVIIALLDTFVAVAAGVVIFPIVFANGLEAGQGPGLMFITIPLAFGHLPMGALFGTIFFMLVSFAAITSAISLTEPALSYLVEEYNAKRKRVAISLGVMCWILGLGTVFSFNIWSTGYIVGEMTVFDFVDYLSQNIMLPLGGMLIAVFAVWVLPQTAVGEQLGIKGGFLSVLWKLLAGVVAPVCVLVIFVYTVLPLFSNLA
jgi:neurotransmitter:Na+ symporter, NSS family